MFIYKITNKINGKVYVGQTTKSVEHRFYLHCKNKKTSKLTNAINKYGKENFIIQTLEICTSTQELNEKEIYWIKQLNCIDSGYNIQTGGYVRDSMRGKKHKKETIEKMRISALGKNNSQFGLRAELSPNYGKKQSEIHRINNGKAHAKPVICVETNEVFSSGKCAADHFKVNAANLNKVLKGKSKTCSGYTFRYAEVKND